MNPYTKPSRATSLYAEVPDTKRFLVDVMSKSEKRTFFILVSIWFVTLIWFWHWWLYHHHVITWMGMSINTLLIAWNTLLPGYYFYFVARMKTPNPKIEIPDHWRVAMVVTKAPSEPWAIVQRTVEAMLAQSHPHDNWLADEDPQPETVAWCKANGVQVSTRKGIAEYHQPTWPRRTRCKEGNLAYFYDKYGYDRYDVVVQLDADHVPELGYLEAMIRPFVNPKVGYVAAPSICDANSHESWVVNARLFAEATMHGSLQAGYNDGWAPLCIGSHYAVRAQAVKDIGGLGPELAEDHTTTLMMNSRGWQGVFAFDAEAHGDGPGCFADFLVQEYQWSRSLMVVLLAITPRYWKGLKPHLKFQFIFAQLWYPFFAITILIGSSLPILALINDQPWVKVSYFEFFLRSLALTLACVAPVNWVASRQWLRPKNAKVLSWETVLFQFARWPWILAGVYNATVSCILKKELPFRVTPKGGNAPKPLPIQVLFPYFLLGLVCAIAVIILGEIQHAKGYYFLTLVNSGIYITLILAIIWLHIRENAPQLHKYVMHNVALVFTFGLFATAAGMRSQEGIQTIVKDAPKIPIPGNSQLAQANGLGEPLTQVAETQVSESLVASIPSAEELTDSPWISEPIAPSAISAYQEAFARDNQEIFQETGTHYQDDTNNPIFTEFDAEFFSHQEGQKEQLTASLESEKQGDEKADLNDRPWEFASGAENTQNTQNTQVESEPWEITNIVAEASVPLPGETILVSLPEQTKKKVKSPSIIPLGTIPQ
ncbi:MULTISPECIES: glycosyltransferase family 2 protein [Spirulina sp. CCY15215]|uniref:glycosyltransferase family 2 protein n=1 Tax=Spirulina sp. CCY15215 TaxID=2767591 RepID=UPI0019504C5A|nr:glycosyltransferase family 2 protein [Spirulina major]